MPDPAIIPLGLATTLMLPDGTEVDVMLGLGLSITNVRRPAGDTTPVVTVTPDDPTVTAGDTVTFMITWVGGPATRTVYRTFGDGSPTTSATMTSGGTVAHVYSAAGSYTFEARLDTVGGPLGTAGVTVAFSPATLDGPLLLWAMGEGSGPVVKNAFAGTPNPCVNRWAAAEQLAGLWSPDGATLTNNYANNPDGNPTATRVQMAAGGTHSISYQISCAPNTDYVLSFYAKSNTGSDQMLARLSFDASGVSGSTVVTAAGGWQRVVVPLHTGGGSSLILYLLNAADAALDMLLWGFQFEPGTLATAYTRQQLDLCVTPSTPLTWTPTGLAAADASAGGLAINNTGTALGTDLTVYLVGKSASSSSYRMGLTDLSGYAALRIDAGSAEYGFTYGGRAATEPGARLDDGDWHVLAGVASAAGGLEYYVDDTLICRNANPPTGYTSYGVRLGVQFGFVGDYGAAAVYTAAHDQTARRAMTTYLRGLMAGRGETLTDLGTFVLFEGDSITGLGADGSWPAVTMSSMTARYQYHNAGVGGSVLTGPGNSVAARTADDNLRLYPAKSRAVLCVLIGANCYSTAPGSDAAFVADLKAYCLSQYAEGWTDVLVGTITPSTLVAGFNPWRNAVNTLVRADASFYDGLMDFAADATIGPDGAADDPALYSDKLHPTTAAKATYFAPVAKAALEAIGM